MAIGTVVGALLGGVAVFLARRSNAKESAAAAEKTD
jgi:gas vesicle protein